jgi:hypothetical protein
MGLAAFKDLGNCHSLAPPRKSLVKGERFVRHDGTSDLLALRLEQAANEIRFRQMARLWLQKMTSILKILWSKHVRTNGKT